MKPFQNKAFLSTFPTILPSLFSFPLSFLSPFSFPLSFHFLLLFSFSPFLVPLLASFQTMDPPEKVLHGFTYFPLLMSNIYFNINFSTWEYLIYSWLYQWRNQHKLGISTSSEGLELLLHEGALQKFPRDKFLVLFGANSRMGPQSCWIPKGSECLMTRSHCFVFASVLGNQSHYSTQKPTKTEIYKYALKVDIYVNGGVFEQSRRFPSNSVDSVNARIFVSSTASVAVSSVNP